MKKKLIYLTGLVGLGAMLLLVQPQDVTGTIVNSSHDFSNQGWAQNRICRPCHIPHNSIQTVTTAPLWNHTLTTATFTPYTNGGTMDSNPQNPGASTTSISRLCLSCHDGTVALDAYGGATGNTSTNLTNSSNAFLSTDLSNDHPVALQYNASLATTDGELYDPTTQNVTVGNATSNSTGTIAAKMLFGSSNDQLECASCHDVHNTSGNTKMLVKSNNNSDLCLACHRK